jgi:hypothetical protein
MECSCCTTVATTLLRKLTGLRQKHEIIYEREFWKFATEYQAY